MAVIDNVLDIIADTILNINFVAEEEEWSKDIDRETIV